MPVPQEPKTDSCLADVRRMVAWIRRVLWGGHETAICAEELADQPSPAFAGLQIAPVSNGGVGSEGGRGRGALVRARRNSSRNRVAPTKTDRRKTVHAEQAAGGAEADAESESLLDLSSAHAHLTASRPSYFSCRRRTAGSSPMHAGHSRVKPPRHPADRGAPEQRGPCSRRHLLPDHGHDPFQPRERARGRWPSALARRPVHST